jgi:hypothetical protein
LKDLTKVPQEFIKAQLNALPSGLEETYLEYFRGINAQPQAARTLAQWCFLWTFHAKKRLTGPQLRDAVSLGIRTSGNEDDSCSVRTMEQVTKDLLHIPAFAFFRVRPIHFSLQEYATSSNSLPSDLRDFLLDSESANGQLAILCLEHLMADVPPIHEMDTILVYCGKYFTVHIHSLTSIPDGLIDLLDRLFTKEPYKLLNILKWRWPISRDSYPDLNCAGSPKSVDPVFFMKCLGFDKLDALWTRYCNIERPTCYPDGYLHLAVVARREDLVKDIIAEGAKLDYLDVDGRSALHYCCEEGIPLDIVKLLVEAGADINLRTPEGESPLKLINRSKYVKIFEFLEGIGAIE